MLGAFTRQRNLATRSVLMVMTKILQVCSGSLNVLVSLPGLLSLQSCHSPCPCAHVRRSSPEDVQVGPDIENSSLIIISFNCLFYFVELIII